jgi:hypothetical protein
MTKCRLVIKMRPRAWHKFGMAGAALALLMLEIGVPVLWLYTATVDNDVAS